MPIALAPLPYDKDALEPSISAETLDYHYGKHHRGYVDKLNKLIAGTPFENLELEEIIERARGEAMVDVLNNAQQAWNHTFFWESLSPNGGSQPNGRMRISFTSELTMALNEAPIIIPTAISSTFPRNAKFLNSFNMRPPP